VGTPSLQEGRLRTNALTMEAITRQKLAAGQ
jgi:hypothetical protein